MTIDEKIRFTFRIPLKLFNAIKSEAKEQGVSANALILQIIWDWLKER